MIFEVYYKCCHPECEERNENLLKVTGILLQCNVPNKRQNHQRKKTSYHYIYKNCFNVLHCVRFLSFAQKSFISVQRQLQPHQHNSSKRNDSFSNCQCLILLQENAYELLSRRKEQMYATAMAAVVVFASHFFCSAIPN